MILMLDLADKVFKTTVINIIKILEEKMDKIDNTAFKST